MYETLLNYDVPSLKKLASLVATKLPTRKADLVDLLQEKLLNRNFLETSWEKLGALQKAAVAETLHNPTLTYNRMKFEAKYGASPSLGTIQKYGREKPQFLSLFILSGKIPLDAAKVLELFISAPEMDTVTSLETLPGNYTIPAQEYYPARENISVTISHTERAALHDVLAVLRLIDAGRISASDKTKRAGKAGQKAITEILYGGDFYAPEQPVHKYEQVVGSIKAFAWPLLVQAARLVELAGTRLRLTSSGVKSLSAPPAEAIRNIWERWQNTKYLDEMNRVEAIRGQSGKGKRNLTSPNSRRAVIVSALRHCPLDRWIAFAELSRFMRSSGHDFEVTRDAWTLYLSDRQYGSLGYKGFGGWDILQERYVRAFLFEYAATLGLIDVAYIHPADAQRDFRRLWGVDDLSFLSRYDGLLYFRITPLGAWCLGMAEIYEPRQVEEEPLLRVLPNYDIVALKPLAPGDVFFLDTVSERSGDFVWTLERGKLLAAAEKGHSVADLRDFLTAKSADDLPAILEVFFQDLQERSTSLTEVGKAVLIEAKNPDVALLVSHDSRLKSLCMTAGDRHLVVLEQYLETFSIELHKLGFSVRKGGVDSSARII